MLGDRGYDAEAIRQGLGGLCARHIVPWLAKRDTDHGSGLGRWRSVVERTFAWLNQFRRLRVRYEKRRHPQASLALTCALLCWNVRQKHARSPLPHRPRNNPKILGRDGLANCIFRAPDHDFELRKHRISLCVAKRFGRSGAGSMLCAATDLEFNKSPSGGVCDDPMQTESKAKIVEFPPAWPGVLTGARRRP